MQKKKKMREKKLLATVGAVVAVRCPGPPKASDQ